MAKNKSKVFNEEEANLSIGSLASITPLADRMRPERLENFLGQDEIVGEGKMLWRAIKSDTLPSMIFWGTPGSGKTALAFIIAKETKADFIQFSAVTSGVEELRKVIKRAEENANPPRPLYQGGFLPPLTPPLSSALQKVLDKGGELSETPLYKGRLGGVSRKSPQSSLIKREYNPPTPFYKGGARKTILFIDEIHRWNKAQQDALLPHVERGTIILIGATTENPSFEVRGALLSRLRVFVLKQLTEKHISDIIKRALADKEKGLGKLNIKMDEKTIGALAKMSNGDARVALNILEYAAMAAPHPTIPASIWGGSKIPRTPFIKGALKYPPDKGGEGGYNEKLNITLENIKEAFQKSHLLYDKDGEEHYNIISALHKSMRGSDANAALYWLARMLEAGEDPLYVARRLVRFASEDIGLANSRALEQTVAAFNACQFIGMPECNVILAQVVVYLSKCKKSNDLYIAYGQAAQDVKEYGNLPVPLHIRNAPTKLMKDLKYGEGYKYSPEFDYKEEQEYLPEELKGRKYLK